VGSGARANQRQKKKRREGGRVGDGKKGMPRENWGGESGFTKGIKKKASDRGKKKKKKETKGKKLARKKKKNTRSWEKGPVIHAKAQQNGKRVKTKLLNTKKKDRKKNKCAGGQRKDKRP